MSIKWFPDNKVSCINIYIWREFLILILMIYNLTYENVFFFVEIFFGICIAKFNENSWLYYYFCIIYSDSNIVKFKRFVVFENCGINRAHGCNWNYWFESLFAKILLVTIEFDLEFSSGVGSLSLNLLFANESCLLIFTISIFLYDVNCISGWIVLSIQKLLF